MIIITPTLQAYKVRIKTHTVEDLYGIHTLAIRYVDPEEVEPPRDLFKAALEAREFIPGQGWVYKASHNYRLVALYLEDGYPKYITDDQFEAPEDRARVALWYKDWSREGQEYSRSLPVDERKRLRRRVEDLIRKSPYALSAAVGGLFAEGVIDRLWLQD